MRRLNRLFVWGISPAEAAMAVSAGPGTHKIGVGQTVITPPLDVPMAGYYYPRAAEVAFSLRLTAQR